jgi:hypothetical protein
VRQRSAGQPERGLEHDREDRGEPLRVELGQGRDMLQPGVIHQHVHLGRQRVHRVEVGEVAGHGLDSRHLLRERLHARLVQVDGQHRRAVGCHPTCHGHSDSAGRTGDEGSAAGERRAQGGGRHGARR